MTGTIPATIFAQIGHAVTCAYCVIATCKRNDNSADTDVRRSAKPGADRTLGMYRDDGRRSAQLDDATGAVLPQQTITQQAYARRRSLFLLQELSSLNSQSNAFTVQSQAETFIE